MNGEPPQGDDLQRMLVSMKQQVLERATPRPRRRGRPVGIAVGVVSVLLLGLAGGGVALGLIPTSTGADPVPSATVAPESEPSTSTTPSGSPVVDRPTPTPTPTPSRAPYSVADPSTWTISGDEVGPIAIGGPVDGELDDLDAAYTREGGSEDGCANPDVTSWRGSGSNLTVVERQGRVWGVYVTATVTDAAPPTTAAGLGIGSTLDELRAAYPDLAAIDRGDGVPSTAYSLWGVERGGQHVTFQFGEDDSVVTAVWDSVYPAVPYEFCG